MAHLQAKKIKAFKRSLAFITAIAFSVVFCHFHFGTHNAVTGRHELTFVSVNEEIEIGEEIFNELINEAGGRYTEDAVLNAYVSRVGQKLAKVSDRPNLPWEFVIVNDNSLNAWALPGGKIAINKGLLMILDNEAELSAILAHEITHAAARHAAQRWERSTLRPAIETFKMIFNPAHAMIVAADIPTDMIEFKYSRDAEFEADKYGMEYMARAGYDIHAAVTVHEKLQKEFGHNEDPYSLVDTILSSHPEDAERVSQIVRLSQFYPAEGILAATEYKAHTAMLFPLMDATAVEN